MASTTASDREHEQDRDIQRYRQAAIHALGQLEWVVGYLHKIRRPDLARALDRSREQILERIR
jgi:hypothetical protein